MEQFKPHKKSIENEIGVEDKKKFENEIQKFIREFLYHDSENVRTRMIWEKPENINFDRILESSKYCENFNRKYRIINPEGIPTSFIGPDFSGSQIINPDTAFIDYENMGQPEIIDIINNPDYLDWLKGNKKNKSVKSILEYVIEKYSTTHHLPGVEYLKYLLENRNREMILDTLKDGELYIIPSAIGSNDNRRQFPAKNRNKDIFYEDWSLRCFKDDNGKYYPKEDVRNNLDYLHFNEMSMSISPKVVLFKRKEGNKIEP